MIFVALVLAALTAPAGPSQGEVELGAAGVPAIAVQPRELHKKN